MGKFVYFTSAEKRQANEIDLPSFLLDRGEKLIVAGRDYRLASDHSITVRGPMWYDHAARKGGRAISFVQQFYDRTYPEAVTMLLGRDGQGIIPIVKKEPEPREPKPFALPEAYLNMRRLYAYLTTHRRIDRDVVTAFVREKLLYEDALHHNCVFVGKDEHGEAKHAHLRSTNSQGKVFRINVEGSDPRYSFHWNGTSDRLYVFEAPIDLLSFLTLYPKDWQRHSYVALCGVGEQAMLWMLEQAPEFRRPILCLDHDAAGIEATGRLKEILAERGYAETAVLQSIHKDWNEDVKARCGLEAQSAEEHPQLMAAPEVCKRVCAMSTTVKLDRLNIEVPWLIEQYRTHLHWGQFDQAMDCMEQASALAVAACRRELRQLGMAATEDELTKLLCERIRPHRNRGSLKKRHRELAPQFQSVLALEDAVGLRTQEEKKTLAGRWLELAAAFAGVPIQYEAEQIKQRETQPTLNMELGVTL